MKNHPDPEIQREIWENMRRRLMQLTVTQLRQIAKDESITLGYAASRKDTLVDEIVAQRRYRANQINADPNSHPWREWNTAVPKHQ